MLTHFDGLTLATVANYFLRLFNTLFKKHKKTCFFWKSE